MERNAFVLQVQTEIWIDYKLKDRQVVTVQKHKKLHQ